MTRYWIQPSDNDVRNVEYKFALKIGDKQKLDELKEKGFVPSPWYETVSDFGDEMRDLYLEKIWDYIYDISIEKVADEVALILGVEDKSNRPALVGLLGIICNRNRLNDRYGKTLFTEIGFEEECNDW